MLVPVHELKSGDKVFGVNWNDPDKLEQSSFLEIRGKHVMLQQQIHVVSSYNNSMTIMYSNTFPIDAVPILCTSPESAIARFEKFIEYERKMFMMMLERRLMKLRQLAESEGVKLSKESE